MMVLESGKEPATLTQVLAPAGVLEIDHGTGRDSLVLPKVWTHKFNLATACQAEPIPGPSAALLTDPAKRLAIWIIWGTIPFLFPTVWAFSHLHANSRAVFQAVSL
jgi:hypothetical protein